VNKVKVHKARTNTIIINLGQDISGDVFTSEVRVSDDHESTLLMTWNVAFTTDGTDGKLTLWVDNTITEDIAVDSGYMDLKRMAGSEPIPVFDKPLEVIFQGSVTA
jgi:hypothetical protein